MLPQAVKTVLWSYDTDKIDISQNKKIIVSQVLNFGGKEATDWLFDYFGKKDVAKIARTIPLSQWDKKSLALWSLVFGFKKSDIKTRIN